LADPNTRQGKRTPVTLKIKFKSETLEQFIERYAVDVSQGGIFIRTKEPLAVGTQMKFEFQLRDASPLIAGEGTVVWTRENDPSRPAIAPGMGVRFDRLAEGSQGVLEKILAEKAKQAPQRTQAESSKPPLFTDTPTRVAPAPVQDALLGQNSKATRSRADSQETPLPKPMPFHSDADEFGAEAFEEATKVRALDELVAQTAAAEGSAPAAGTPAAVAAASDELAARRTRDSGPPKNLAELERDSAPGLPSPPESGNTGRTAKLLDTSPSPRGEQAPARNSSPSVQPPLDGAKTRLGLEPAKAQTGGRYEPTDRVPSQRMAAAAEPAEPPPHRPSSAPIVIGIVFTIAVAAAAFWYFVLREHVAEEVTTQNPATNPGSGSALGSGSATPDLGSAGSAVAITGSNGSATEAPKGPLVDTEIASNVAKATVTVVDSDQTGAAPFKAKLEKDKAYKVKVEAPGYTAATLDVKGGQDKVTAKLVAKPRIVSVSSTPPGGMIYVDGVATSKRTPADVELSTAQGAKKQVHIQVRLAGYRMADQVIDPSTMQDSDDKMTTSVETKLVVAPVVVNNNNNTTHNQTNNGSGSGSAAVTPETGSGAGSATPSNGGTSGTGSATTPPPPEKPAGGGSGEPEPDWSKKPNP
jgi:uncharacterized protein (TIGR02266 family)